MGAQFVTNAGALALKHSAFAMSTRAKFEAAAKAHADFLVAIARELSSGTTSTEELIAMGHPYSTRYAPNSGPSPDYVINAQTGALRDGWQARADLEAGNWVVLLWNETSYAKFMMGTDRMRKRPILDELDERSAMHLQQMLTAVLFQNAREYNFGTAATPIGAGGGLFFAIWAGSSSLVQAVARAV